MRDISLHIYDIAQNAIEAAADHIFITVLEHRFILADNGRGMDEETRLRALRGGFTTRPSGHGGHGLQALARNASSLCVLSTPGVGTMVDASFPSEFPEGDAEVSLRLLAQMNPDIAWIFRLHDAAIFDTRAMRRGAIKGG